MDLRELWRGDTTLTPRFVLWLVEHLPEDSATSASMRGGRQHRAWTSQLHLEAAVVNLLYSANRQRAGKPTRKAPIEPPKRKRAAARRVIDLSKLPSTRKAPPTPGR